MAKTKKRKLKKQSVKPSLNLEKGGGPSNAKCPKFCFEHLHSEYSIARCSKEEKAAFADTLEKLSKLTWAQLHQSGRHGCGYEHMNLTDLGKPLPPSISMTEDSKVIVFRFGGRRAMVGQRIDELFRVIFLDRNFTLYDH